MISVIIVTLNEVENLKNTIKIVRNSALLSSGKSLPIEIIVSDGGSIDGTLEIAEEFADKVVLSQKGRYIQLNEGAKVSNGEILPGQLSRTNCPFALSTPILTQR